MVYFSYLGLPQVVLDLFLGYEVEEFFVLVKFSKEKSVATVKSIFETFCVEFEETSCIYELLLKI